MSSDNKFKVDIIYFAFFLKKSTTADVDFYKIVVTVHTTEKLVLPILSRASLCPPIIFSSISRLRFLKNLLKNLERNRPWGNWVDRLTGMEQI